MLEEDPKQLEELLNNAPKPEIPRTDHKSVHLKKVRRHRHSFLPHFPAKRKGELKKNLLLLGAMVILALIIGYLLVHYLENRPTSPTGVQGKLNRLVEERASVAVLSCQ